MTRQTPDTAGRSGTFRNRADVVAIVVLLALTSVMMWHRWVFDNWLARHDLLTFFLPWFGALGDRLRDLDVPALNPYIFSGAPFAGDPESGWMYLPAMLLFPFFEVTVAYKLMILLLLVLAGTSTYALARLIGYSVIAALFSSVAFEFGPFMFGQTDCCTVGTMTMAFLPLAFLGVEIGVRARTWPTRILGWVIGGLAISQMFAAWLGQGVVNALLLIAAWVVFRTLITPPDPEWDTRQRIMRMITTGPAVLVLGLLLGAAGILPRLAANAESNNAGGRYETTPGAADYPFHTLASVLESLISDAYDYRGTSVWGVVLVLMLLSLILMRRRSTTPFFAVAAIIIPALAMGAPIISDLFYLIPLYEEMHVHSPGRILWLYPFIPAMLAGAAVHELPRLARMRGKWLVAIAPMAVLSAAGVYVNSQREIGVGSWFWVSVILTTLLLLAWLGSTIRERSDAGMRALHTGAAALVALTFLLPNGVDIAQTLRRDDPPPGELVMWGNDPWMQDLIHESLRRDDPGGAGEFLQRQRDTQPPFRFIAYGGMYHPDTVWETYPERRLEPAMVAILQNSRPMRLLLETTQGYDPVQPLVYQEFMQVLNRREQNYHYANLVHTGVNSRLIDLLNVRYIVVDRNIPESRADHRALAKGRTEVYRDENVIIYEVPTAMPRAWMVYDVRPATDGAASLSIFASGEADGGEVALVEGEPPPVSPPADGSEARVTVSRSSPDGKTLEVDNPGEGLLVVSEVYSDGWKATVDGKEVEVLQADHALLGIPLGPGQHTVEVRYEPASLTLGIWISGVTGIGILVACGWAGWRGFGSRHPTSDASHPGVA